MRVFIDSHDWEVDEDGDIILFKGEDHEYIISASTLRYMIEAIREGEGK